MRVATVVFERRTRLAGHAAVEDEADPVRATLHLDHGPRYGVAQRLRPVEAGRHVEQMPQGDRSLALVEIGKLAIGEEVEHALIKALEKSILECNGDQAADHRLSRRVDAVLQARLER